MKTILLLFVCLLFATAAQDKKLKPEELAAKHLAALGTMEARAAAKTRVASGTTKVVNVLGGAGNVEGKGMMVSDGPKFRFGMNFPALDYPGEDMAFDGTRAATGFLREGRRSNLSVFLNSQPLVLKEGLLGGVLSTAWPLARLEQTQPRLDYRGLKKVDGRTLHEMNYRPRKGGGDVNVLLWFEPETFRHVRSSYSFEIGPRLGNGPNESSRGQESYYVLTETFDDFRAVDGLTLPHKYKMQLSVQTQLGSLLSDWTFEIRGISHKEQFDPQVFTIN